MIAANRATYNSIEIVCDNFGYKLLTSEKDYDNSKGSKFELRIIDKDGYLYNATRTRLKTTTKRGYKLERFDEKNKFALLNIRTWLKVNNKPFSIMLQEYCGAKEKLYLLCNICKKTFSTTWDSLSSGTCNCRCSFMSIDNKFPNLIDEWDFDKNKKPPSEYSYGSGKYVFWLCKNCGNSWKANIHNRTSLGRGCPRCSSSKGEKIIYEYLKNKKISFIMHKGFPNCKYIKSLPFDFYIKDMNTCIEYQGIQHYVPTGFGGTSNYKKLEKFDKNKERDSIKKEYCLLNGIRLIEIPYWEIQNINNILDEFLGGDKICNIH
jgi:hypothetical protein